MSRPVGFGDDLLGEWDCLPLTRARDLSEREHGVIYAAWHENVVRVWERDLRSLGDGQHYETRWHVVKRLGKASYDLFDRNGQRRKRIVSTSQSKALQTLLDMLVSLEGETA